MVRDRNEQGLQSGLEDSSSDRESRGTSHCSDEKEIPISRCKMFILERMCQQIVGKFKQKAKADPDDQR